jgi:exopolysaccharide production protein ExoQ
MVLPFASPAVSERARPLWWACAAVFACMPPAMAFAHRSAPLFVTLATVLALMACAREGSLPALAGEAKASLRTPLGAAALVFLLYAALSLVWSPARGKSLYAYGELILPLGASFVLALTLPERAPRWLWLLLGLFAVGATLVLLIDLSLGLPVRRAMRWRMNTFVYNRPALTLLVMAPPLITALAMQGRRWLGLIVAFFLAVAIFQSESGAAKLGLLVALGAYTVARWHRAAALAIATAAVVAAVALAPVTGQIMRRAMPAAAHQALAASSSQTRVDVWRSFGAAVREQPWLGAGFSPGPAFTNSPGAAAIDSAYQFFLKAGHPHNGALQIWSELGAIGAFLALLVLCLILRGLSGLPPATFAAAVATMAAATAASLVGHGLWQGWWPAAIGAAIVCVLMLRRLEEEKSA